MSRRLLAIGLILVALAPAAAPCARAEEAPTPPGNALLPESSFHLSAARYAPVEPALQWTTWIGIGVGMARLGRTTLFGTADLETVLGNERRAFDARQANYHLQFGARRPLGGWTAELYFDHVSRHVVDRVKSPAVDWNVLGLRLSRELSEAAVPTRFSLGLGHTTLASAVGYRLEASAGVESDLVRWSGGLGFVRGRLRLVTIEPEPEIERDDFVDSLLEGGVRFERGGRAAELYVAWERRNDVRLLEPGARSRALFGLRFMGGAPALLGSQLSGLGPRPGAVPD